jgi:hypothetical protein
MKFSALFRPVGGYHSPVHLERPFCETCCQQQGRIFELEQVLGLHAGEEE